MQSRDIFSLAYRSVSANRLRAGLTIAIIAFGIMALVGILTAIDSMKGSIYSSFANMGANSFSIRAGL
jgi:putative ABC transport system permease protein